jgi:toxin-antitoxin system PIN domain toxin
MKVLDANLLFYAYDEHSPLHASAKPWLIDCLESSEVTGLSYGTVLAFVRITTSARIFQQPFSTEEACDIVDEWLRIPSVSLLGPTERHWSIFERLAIQSQARGPLVPDADLAATAIEHGATLCTHDRDFTRFENLRVEFPLVQK